MNNNRRDVAGSRISALTTGRPNSVTKSLELLDQSGGSSNVKSEWEKIKEAGRGVPRIGLYNESE